jgi:hypothetical protein
MSCKCYFYMWAYCNCYLANYCRDTLISISSWKNTSKSVFILLVHLWICTTIHIVREECDLWFSMPVMNLVIIFLNILRTLCWWSCCRASINLFYVSNVHKCFKTSLYSIAQLMFKNGLILCKIAQSSSKDQASKSMAATVT